MLVLDVHSMWWPVRERVHRWHDVLNRERISHELIITAIERIMKAVWFVGISSNWPSADEFQSDSVGILLRSNGDIDAIQSNRFHSLLDVSDGFQFECYWWNCLNYSFDGMDIMIIRWLYGNYLSSTGGMSCGWKTIMEGADRWHNWILSLWMCAFDSRCRVGQRHLINTAVLIIWVLDFWLSHFTRNPQNLNVIQTKWTPDGAQNYHEVVYDYLNLTSSAMFNTNSFFSKRANVKGGLHNITLE